MQSKCANNRHFICFRRGEEICEGINAYLRTKDIRAGTISGIGAADHVSLRYYDVEKKEYFSRDFDGQFEITSLMGNISVVDGKPWAHLHIVIGDTEYRAFSGHLHAARTGVTCEVIIDASNTEIVRCHDGETGLRVWDLADA